MRRQAIVLAICCVATLAATGLSAADPLRRGSLSGDARALLERADSLQRTGDFAGALDAYMAAVHADRNAADLGLIDRYSGRADLAAPPPPTASPADLKAEQEKAGRTKARLTAALRQYLQLRPDDREATTRLISVVELPEAESLIAASLKAHPTDPDLFAMRGAIRAKQNEAAALDDYEKAAALDPHNAERFYLAGISGYNSVSRGTTLSTPAKSDLIKRAIADLRRAEELKPEYFEAMTYHSLLLRQQAQLETNPAVQKKLSAEADAVREQSVAIIRKRSNATQEH